MTRKWPLIAMGLFVVVVVTVVGLVIGPNFTKYRYKSKRAEAKYMLKVLLTKEQEHRAARGVWATQSRQLVEFMASGPRSSTCFFGEKGWTERPPALSLDQLPVEVKAKIRANDPANGDDFTIACAVNLDEDPDLEVWTISVKAPEPTCAVRDLDAE